MKALVDNKMNVTENIKSFLGMAENIMGKGIFSFLTIFSKGFFFKVVKSQDCVRKELALYQKRKFWTCPN